jgi:two-component system LytT family sensor kinase
MPAYRRLDWRLVLGLWTGVGLLLVLQTYLALASETRGWKASAHVFTVMAQMYRAWLWAGLTPFVFALRREIQRRHQNPFVIGALHVLAALALLAWSNVVRIWAVELTFGYWELEKLSLTNIYRLLNARTVIDFYLYWVVLAVGYGYDLLGEKRQTEVREEQLRTQLVQAELAALKHQVQPHFLFNALNAIASLMRDGESTKAVEALAQLSSLLRQLMNCAGRQEIELWRELDYAQCYLAIEKVRFEERLITHFDADEGCLDALVPTLILQPLVENAVKHGIAQRRSPGRVTVTAHRAGDVLRLEVANDAAEGGRHASERDNHGIGLRATRSRLERIFGERQKLDCLIDGPEGTVVTIELPLRFAGKPEERPLIHTDAH